MDRAKMLFLTHTPEFYRVGDTYEGRWADGGSYKITRIVETTPTSLFCGGKAPCFEVYGTTGGTSGERWWNRIPSIFNS